MSRAPWTLADHLDFVVTQQRLHQGEPLGRTLDLLEAFDVAYECEHGNVPGAPGDCGCFPTLVFVPAPILPETIIWMSKREIERYAGAGHKWVSLRLRPYRKHARFRKNRAGSRSLHYPKSIAEAIRVERIEFLAAPDAGNWLSVSDLVKIIPKSYLWIAKTLFRSHFKPERRRRPGQRGTNFYPPEVVLYLEELAREYPESGDWVTFHQIAWMLGAEYSWVQRRMEELGVKGEMRMRPGYGRPFMHYPPEVVTHLAELRNLHTAAGDWLTAHAMRLRLDRSLNWMLERLPRYHDWAEVRLDSQNVARIHYPPEAFRKLERESQVLKKLGGNSKGLEFRLALLKRLKAQEKTTTELAGKKVQAKSTYDALLWLEKRKFVSSVRGREKTWKLTSLGIEILSMMNGLSV
jgi:hypothetical protein